MAIDPIQPKTWPGQWADPHADARPDLGSAWRKARRQAEKPAPEPARRGREAFTAPADGIVMWSLWVAEPEAPPSFEETIARVEILAARRAEAYAEHGARYVGHGAHVEITPSAAPGERLDAQA